MCTAVADFVPGHLGNWTEEGRKAPVAIIRGLSPATSVRGSLCAIECDRWHARQGGDAREHRLLPGRLIVARD